MKPAFAAALVAAFLCAPASAAVHPRGPFPFPPINPAPAPSKTPLTDVLKKLKAGGSNLIGQLQTIEWQATQPFPGTNPPAPWDPYAAACMPPLIAFIQSTPTQASVPHPQPGMATGPLVDLYHVRLRAIEVDRFVIEIGERGFPPALVIGCGGFAASVPALAGKLTGNVTQNMLALLTYVAVNMGAQPRGKREPAGERPL